MNAAKNVVGFGAERLLSPPPRTASCRRQAGLCSAVRRSAPVVSMLFSACAVGYPNPRGIMCWWTARQTCWSCRPMPAVPIFPVRRRRHESEPCGKRRPSWITAGHFHASTSTARGAVAGSPRVSSAPAVRRDLSIPGCIRGHDGVRLRRNSSVTGRSGGCRRTNMRASSIVSSDAPMGFPPNRSSPHSCCRAELCFGRVFSRPRRSICGRPWGSETSRAALFCPVSGGEPILPRRIRAELGCPVCAHSRRSSLTRIARR